MSTEGAIYCRISKDAEGLALGVDRQRDDCIELARQQGIVVQPEHILIENDVGASAKSKKARPQYEKLKELVRTGTVKAVVFYSNSRLTRRTLELEEWITLHEQTGVLLVSKASGQDDLGTADGRMVARIKASVDAAEAERISERVKRSFEQRRAQGEIPSGGPRPFGWTRSAGVPELVPGECAAIRQGADMLLSGATYGEVAKAWTAAGVQPVRAKTWTRESLRNIYSQPRIAGLIQYEGEIVGEGKFPAIIDRATWEAVQEAVKHAPTRPAGYGARVHVLAGFVFCGICGATMVAQSNAFYRCVKERQGCGGVKRNKAWLDALVNGYVVGKLSTAKPVELSVEDTGHAAEIEELEQKIVQVREQHIAGELDSEDFFPLLSGYRAKLNALRKEEVARTRNAQKGAVLADPLAVWKGGTLSGKRAVLAGVTKGIYVKPVGRIGRAPIPVESVDILPGPMG